MILKINAQRLEQAVFGLDLVVDTSSTAQPLYRNILFQIQDNYLTIGGLDFELYYVAKIPFTVNDPFPNNKSFLLDALDFFTLIRGINYSGAPYLLLSINDSSVTVIADDGETKFSRSFSSVKEFPELFDFDMNSPFLELPTKQFSLSLDRLSHSICEDETRQNLMMIHIGNNCMIAADGARIGVLPFTWAGDDIDIPARSVTPLVKLLKASKQSTFKLQQKKDFLFFKIDNDTFSVLQVSKEHFPEISAHLKAAEQNTVHFSISRKILESHLILASSYADKANRAVKFHFSASKGLILSSSKDDSPDSTNTISTSVKDSKWPHSDFVAYYNADHVLECLNTSKNRIADFYFNISGKYKPMKYMEMNPFGQVVYQELIVPRKMNF